MNSIWFFVIALAWGVYFPLPNGVAADVDTNKIVEQLRQNCLTRPSRRMYGATRASTDSGAWMALLHLPDDMVSCRCSGTLVTNNFVLTAAHCWASCPRRGDYRVCLGSKTITSASNCLENFGVEDIFMNDFNYFEQINDIALIKMNGRVRYTNVIYPVCLPVHYTTQGDTAVAGKIYRSLGWGATEQATHSASLLEINVRSIPCPHNTYGIYFCTTSQRVDVCRGDSGGPLARSFNVSGIIRSVQFGIVAHGSSLKCGIAGGTYYTNVSYYMPWIVEKLAEHTDPILI